MESKDIAKLYGPTQVSVPSHGLGQMVADIKLKRKIGGGDGGGDQLPEDWTWWRILPTPWKEPRIKD